MENNKVISTLNDLIKTCKNGERGFLTSAEDVSDPELKAILNDRARACAEGARELQEQVKRLGGDPENSGSTAGALHRAWENVKARITGKDEKAILEEVERGEAIAVKIYRKALGSDLPPDVRDIVERQFQGVEQNYNQVRKFREQHTPERSPR
ncbi:MAG: PA2169 family four-helix-bundle protein [Pseudomonadota bacterium]|nr:PA2169 family four-helix-bundle protein [Pseudomonadota bacterium]